MKQELLGKSGVGQPIFDIYDFYYVSFWQSKTFYILLSILLVIFVFLLSFLFYKWWQQRRAVLAPWEKAQKQILKLSKIPLRAKEDYKKLYFALTDLLKQYFFMRYGWQLLQKTDDEIITYLKKRQVSDQVINDFENILNSSLTVKFADEAALPERVKLDLKKAKNIIEATTPHVS